MPHGHKRRNFHGPPQGKGHYTPTRDNEHGSKRRRLSDVDEPKVEMAVREPRPQIQNSEDEGWEVVRSKQAKKKAGSSTKSLASTSVDTYPNIRFYKNYKGDIQIKDLQRLALYVLADTIAPNWLAINNSRHIQKVVVLMVPGFDRKLVEKAQKMDEQDHTHETNGTASRARHGEHTESEEDALTPNERKSSPQSIHRLLFDDVLDVRAPGDSRQSRVHSPLQAMLLVPESETKSSSKASNENASKSSRIAITELIHTADELREADYPIHPATFTSKADAELELKRREQTGQSTAQGWMETKISESSSGMPSVAKKPRDFISQDLKIYSLDCEMVMTSDETLSLARISLVRFPDGKVVMDKYVKPSLPVTNYFTEYSGITPAHLENVTTTLHDIQQELLGLLDSTTVIVGHSLESDLNALKLTHPFIVDTSMIYPHPRGLPLRSSLKFLANKHLKREIQTGGARGHDSVEDARAVLDLVKMKCEKGLKWGTMEANGEPIFKRLKRSGRTSTMVEYGTPERGLGKDSTHKISCQNDEEITQGIIRSMHGDQFFDFDIPPKGVDFVWARLRALEFARGWVSSPGQLTKSETPQDDTNSKIKDDNEENDTLILSTLESTLSHIQAIYDALPSRTLFIIFSGTSDMRPVLKLQAMQQQYRKEFKTKKWDELSVKWTDEEEQALKRACEDARQGWGSVIIK